MTRVHIGEKSSRMGAWVSPSGTDASAEGARMILDSDLDNLKPHYAARFDVIVEDLVVEGDPSQGYWGQIANPVVAFPALPFVPLAFIAVSTKASNYNVSFPPGINWDSDPYILASPQFTVSTSSVTINDPIITWTLTAYLYVWVYANQIDGV